MSRIIEVKNQVTGQIAVMSGVSLRYAVAQAYAEYGVADVDGGNPETKYGALIGRDDGVAATIGDWIAQYAS